MYSECLKNGQLSSLVTFHQNFVIHKNHICVISGKHVAQNSCHSMW